MAKIMDEFTGSASGTQPEIAALDDLLAVPAPRLAAMYAAATTPTIGAVKGDLRGRMLATTVLPPAIETLARAWASSDRFVWRGKSFAPHTEHAGDGINRVVVDAFRLFRFETHIGPSRAGDFDALQLNYDLPENPFFIRVIEDEIRQLRDGLWLGQAYLRTRAQPRLVLYFGLTQ